MIETSDPRSFKIHPAVPTNPSSREVRLSVFSKISCHIRDQCGQPDEGQTAKLPNVCDIWEGLWLEARVQGEENDEGLHEGSNHHRRQPGRSQGRPLPQQGQHSWLHMSSRSPRDRYHSCGRSRY